MKLIYTDETYTTQQSEWLGLGAFMIDANDWPKLEDGLQSAVSGYVWNMIIDGDLKNLRNASNDRFDDGEPKECSHSVYEYLDREIDYNVTSVLINRDAYDHRRHSSLREDPYLQAYVLLLERVEIFLTQAADKGMIFIDSRDTTQDNTIKEAHRNLQEYGTDHIDFRRVNNISIPLEDEDSYGLQLADWVVSAVKDWVIDGYTDEFYQHIDPHLLRDNDGDIVGSGIKVYPETFDELNGI